MSSSTAIRAGRAFVELFADDAQLRQGLKGASDRLKAFGGVVNRGDRSERLRNTAAASGRFTRWAVTRWFRCP